VVFVGSMLVLAISDRVSNPAGKAKEHLGGGGS
jgi:hypothetical protein